MKRNIIWSGIEYYSIENCVVETDEAHIRVDSVIVGMYRHTVYRVHYELLLNSDWETQSCIINARINDLITEFRLVRNHGHWTLNDRARPDWSACTDIDIPLTPFTNSLPINRIGFGVGQQRLVEIVYVDILANAVTAVTQKYARLSDTTFRYENVPNDFEADIEVDTDGFVVNYPQLFHRKVRV